jgi:hypothetical protein
MSFNRTNELNESIDQSYRSLAIKALNMSILNKFKVRNFNLSVLCNFEFFIIIAIFQKN